MRAWPDRSALDRTACTPIAPQGIALWGRYCARHIVGSAQDRAPGCSRVRTGLPQHDTAAVGGWQYSKPLGYPNHALSILRVWRSDDRVMPAYRLRPAVVRSRGGWGSCSIVRSRACRVQSRETPEHRRRVAGGANCATVLASRGQKISADRFPGHRPGSGSYARRVELDVRLHRPWVIVPWIRQLVSVKHR